jgi:hypothetical protein
VKATPIYFSSLPEKPRATNGVCHLLRWDNHVFYISNLYKALGQSHCPMCDRRPSPDHFARHIKSCTIRWKKYGTGQAEVYHSAERYKPPLDVFEEIEMQANHCFPSHLKDIHYMATFDSETYFDMCPEPELRGKKTQTLSRMYPFVIGACSNVPGFTAPKLFWLQEDGGGKFVEDFVDYLVEISRKQAELLKEQLQDVYGVLRKKMGESQMMGNNYGLKLFQSLYAKLDQFVSRLPVLSFNGGKFDCKVLRQHLLPALFDRYGMDGVSTSMKDGRYMKISCRDLLFVDQLNYLPAGKCSYDLFIQNTLGKKMKHKFPYEFLTSLDKLKHTQLPPLEEWYSTLKGHNVLEIEHRSYRRYLADGISSQVALKNLGLTEVPKTGQETLDDLHTFFKEQNFQTFADFVAYYLKGDVEPFVQAAEKMSRTFFNDADIQSIYRCYSSIPAVGVKVAFRYMEKCDVFVPSPDTYQLLRDKTPGGQSILVQLEAISGVTPIRKTEFESDALKCSSIFSLE